MISVYILRIKSSSGYKPPPCCQSKAPDRCLDQRQTNRRSDIDKRPQLCLFSIDGLPWCRQRYSRKWDLEFPWNYCPGWKDVGDDAVGDEGIGDIILAGHHASSIMFSIWFILEWINCQLEMLGCWWMRIFVVGLSIKLSQQKCTRDVMMLSS